MVETNEPTNHFNTHQTQWCQSHYEVALNMHHQSLKKFEKVEKTVFFRANTQILKSECTT